MRSGFCWEVKESLKSLHTAPSPGLDLIVSWELLSSQGRIQGHHYMLNLALLSEKYPIPLHMVIHSESEISHDFSACPVLLIPVKLSLKSLSGLPQTFKLEAYDTNVQINDKDNQKPPHLR